MWWKLGQLTCYGYLEIPLNPEHKSLPCRLDSIKTKRFRSSSNMKWMYIDIAVFIAKAVHTNAKLEKL